MRCTRFIALTTLVVAIACTLFFPGMVQAGTADLENLTLASESYWNGTDTTYNNGVGDYNSFSTGGTTFNNYHDWYYSSYFGAEMHYWDGWAYSNRSVLNTSPAGEYTAMGSGDSGQNGADNSANYGVSYVGWYSVPTVTFDAPGQVSGAYFTNNGWAYGSMLNGDSFTKKFGGATGDDEDWFLLTITGKNSSGEQTGTVDFYLADFRFEDNSEDYIVDDWTFADLSSLGNNVKSLEFGLTSSDTGEFGMNTPAYFAIDNVSIVPEPSSLAMLAGGLIVGLMSLRRRRRSC